MRRLASYYVQRRRLDIRRQYPDEAGAFPGDRIFGDVPYTLSPGYRALLDDAIAYASERVTAAGTVGRREQRVAWWSAIALLRSLVSSPRAAAQTLLTRSQTAAAATADEADALGRPVTADMADDSFDGIDASPGADDGGTASTASTAAAMPRDARLAALAERAAALEGPEQDKKLALLIKTVKQLLADGYHPIVFCRYIPTSEYLAEQLDGKLGRKTVVACVNGTLSPAQRLDRIERLAEAAGQEDGARRVLVATDCLSEGVNLQHHFNAVVHYDLAWNPTRHEQREGRVDRFGQRSADVRVVTIYGGDNGIDGKVLEVLIRKHREIRKLTGISVPIPDETSSQVTDAIMEWLLMRGQASADQQALFELDEVIGKTGGELDVQWRSMADREDRSRSRFAQGSIHPDEVARRDRRDPRRPRPRRRGPRLRQDRAESPERRPHHRARRRRVHRHRQHPPARAAGRDRRADRRAPPHPLLGHPRRAARRGIAHPHRSGRRRGRRLRPGERPRPARAGRPQARPPLRRHPHHRGHDQDHAAARPLPLPAHPPRPVRKRGAHRRGRPRARLRRRARQRPLAPRRRGDRAAHRHARPEHAPRVRRQRHHHDPRRPRRGAARGQPPRRRSSPPSSATRTAASAAPSTRRSAA